MTRIKMQSQLFQKEIKRNSKFKIKINQVTWENYFRESKYITHWEENLI